LTPLNFGNVGLKSGKLMMLAHCAGVGVPKNWNILNI